MKPPFKMIIETDLEQWRWDTFWTKEPETIEWIKSFEPQNNTFFDVGANIGIYSLYAASLYPKMKIYAFEPMWINYKKLRENIEFNNFTNIIPIHAALTYNKNLFYNRLVSFEELLIPEYIIGISGAQLNEKIKDDTNNSKEIVMVFSLDEFQKITGKYPVYMKIDVDGLEFEIVKGYRYWDRTKSVLIEINNNSEKIKAIFVINGFTYENEPLNYLENHSRYRRQKEEGNTAENVIFARKK